MTNTLFTSPAVYTQLLLMLTASISRHKKFFFTLKQAKLVIFEKYYGEKKPLFHKFTANRAYKKYAHNIYLK